METSNNIVNFTTIDKTNIIDYDFVVKKNRIFFITEDTDGRIKINDLGNCVFPAEEIFMRESKGKVTFEHIPKLKQLENKFHAILIDKLKHINSINGAERIRELKLIFSLLADKHNVVLVKVNEHAYTLNTLAEIFKNELASKTLIAKFKSDYSNVKIEIS